MIFVKWTLVKLFRAIPEKNLTPPRAGGYIFSVDPSLFDESNSVARGIKENSNSLGVNHQDWFYFKNVAFCNLQLKNSLIICHDLEMYFSLSKFERNGSFNET